MIATDDTRCLSCGLCAADCSVGAIRSDEGGRPTVAHAEACEHCGHCVAACPTGALTHEALEPAAFGPFDTTGITSATMASFLSSKRSCRQFQRRPLSREDVGRLLGVARMAPSSKNLQERGYIVVTDPAKLEEVRRVVVRHTRRLEVLLRWLRRPPLCWVLSADAREAIDKIHLSFLSTLEREDRGEDSIFHGAPCAVFLYAVAADALGKDNALAAQHYLMLQAQAMGLGSVILGYAQVAARKLTRTLEVPREFRIYGAVALGHPAVRYHRTVYRHEPRVHWFEAA